MVSLGQWRRLPRIWRVGESGEIAVASASGTGRGRTPQGRGTSPGSSRRAGVKGRGAPGAVVAAWGHRPPPGLCYEPRLWSMDIALAIPQSDFILVPLLLPDWNSDVLQKPVCAFPLRHRQYYCFCRKLVLTLTHSYTASNSTRALKSTGATSSVDPSLSSLRMEAFFILACLITSAASCAQNFIL